ncbi:resolvase [Sinorhizobium meliloti]|uniref:recombinase family protein n=1 Tax=Rhizobium meliloti TaxID=382 RepID=UPI000B4A3AD4|nr:recombinase family protein [Sinorhizobium meliloti]ASP97021.1 resolvase [Sinorhizobium meliloti]MQV66544.1 helix-turn-helix domain-containing protein [Sinorhizobium meliloti]RVQ43508.1 resolvase [Sinorhizobium meliloti]
MHIRAYLRASTKEQDASRARGDLQRFADERGLKNESGASLARPELFRLLADCHPGDVLLVEQVDRLSRLNAEDWAKLKAEIGTKRVRVVALDLPTSYQLANAGDDFSSRMLDAVNGMMLDMLAAIARKDYEDRRRRQAQGIARAKAENVYKGRPEDGKRNAEIMQMLREGKSWNSIIAATRCSRSTISRLLHKVREQSGSEALR